jgi:hypothetical protein
MRGKVRGVMGPAACAACQIKAVGWPIGEGFSQWYGLRDTWRAKADGSTPVGVTIAC